MPPRRERPLDQMRNNCLLGLIGTLLNSRIKVPGRSTTICALLCLILVCTSRAFSQAKPLQDQLISEGANSLAVAARNEGDPKRGAIVFHQPFLACTKCHSTGQASSPAMLGPDLTRPEKTSTAQSIVESILEPSKAIRKGYEPVVIQLTDGKTLTGIFVEETDKTVVLRDAARIGETISLSKSDIDERVTGTMSIMPVGQVNVLASRQQFLDLARYLIEISEGGAERAKQLQPAASLFAFVLPEYENHIDHAGLVRDVDQKSFERGEAIYQRLCINCHGTKDQPGSLPTSLKFAEGKFKNGNDPYRMYLTLTHGFNLMAPQTWMVPQQKYDVIHYIREAYLKPHNPSQYTAIDAPYLAALPRGDTRGPAASTIEAWSSMNYGPYLIATYEVGSNGSNFAQKGIAVRLDPGPGGIARGKHWQLFDHDTLRLAGAWTATPGASSNFIDWHGINFDGRHQIHPRVSGHVQLANPTGPGWAHPVTGSFEDTRLIGRDNRQYGPLPKDWGQFRGVYQNGDQIVLSYRIGETDILEMPGAVTLGESERDVRSDRAAPNSIVSADGHSSPIFTRTFQIGPRPRPMLLKVATHPADDADIKTVEVKQAAKSEPEFIALLHRKPTAKSTDEPFAFNERTWVEIAKPQDFDLTTRDFSITARIRTGTGGTILCQANADGPWTPNGKTLFIRDGRLTFDIGWVGAVAGKTKITDDQWHQIAATWQHRTGKVQLFVDGNLDGHGSLRPKAVALQQIVRLGFTSVDFPNPTHFVGQMADVRFYQCELSHHQISDVSKIKDARLVAQWSLSDSKDQIFADRTGHGHEGKLSAATVDEKQATIAAGLSPTPAGAAWKKGESGSLLLSLPAGPDPLKFVLSTLMLPNQLTDHNPLDWYAIMVTQPPLDLAALTKGGPRRWPDELQTDLVIGPDDGPFAADSLSLPVNNPWFAQFRPTGFDFFADGDRLAACTWDGDVWLVSGLLEKSSVGSDSSIQPKRLKWRRIANGLFQPLGLKIVKETIYITCRDQLAILRDLNNDGETDFVECFNSDHQVTEHFHEFAMGLQTDVEGNFYYAKSARHALPAVVPHHGTLLKVSADGTRTEIVANGFRAANGVCLNPDGTFVVTDQEGHWNPKNRINWVVPAKPGQKPRFYGNMFGYHDVTDASDRAMEQPLCWITNAFDRSPAELLWVTSDKWGPLKGSLLNLSYGYGKVFVVPFESLKPAASHTEPDSKDAEQPTARVQGGMCEFPMPAFPTGIMRGRFHPQDGALYTCGMFAWAGNAIQPGGFYRVRATGKDVHLPIGLKARSDGMQITFSGDLDRSSVSDTSRFTVRTWALKRSADYGSQHYNEKTLKIASVKLADDRRTVTIAIPEIQPTWGMSIEYTLTGSKGEPVHGLIHNSIHTLK